MTGRSEKAIMNDCLVELSLLPGTLVYRNNTGMAWAGDKMTLRHGQMVRVEHGMVVLRNARAITFGLNGSGDIMGCSNGVPIAGETKTRTGRQADQQRAFQRAWEKAGGRYGLWRSPEDAVADLKRWGCV